MKNYYKKYKSKIQNLINYILKNKYNVKITL